MNQIDRESLSQQDLEAQQKKGRLVMIAIVAVFILPFFIAPLLPPPGEVGKTNKGELIQPHIALNELALTRADGSVVGVEALESKWTLLYVLPDDCIAECKKAREHALYAIRQVRLSLDRNINRVQQLLVLLGKPDTELQGLLDGDFQSMPRVYGAKKTVANTLLNKLGNAGPAGSVFLMSPDGYIFMSYPTFADEEESVLRARDMRYDLKKSIKGERTF